ncbi:MDR family MFS transporter [Paraburkholderia sediminicola]|uniref:MDR family MFS transporter n=1 Tax=Paraburkholderia sediminicola TaxID=458836 RepID=UPI0038BD7D4E
MQEYEKTTAKRTFPISRNMGNANGLIHFKEALWGLVLAIVLSSIDQNIVSTALPHIAQVLGGLPQISWVVTAFLLSSTVSMPIYGKLSDMHGRRSMFMISISIFLLASALCGLATSMNQLIAFRAMQGLGAGGLSTLSQSAIGDLVGPRERGRYQGLFSGAAAVCTVTGPLLGGMLITVASWRWIFFASLPVGLISLVLIVLFLPAPAVRRAHRIDYVGMLLLIVSVCAAMLFLNGVGGQLAGAILNPWITALIAICFSAAFLLWERRATEPIITVGLFRNRTFAVAVAAAGMMTFAMQAAMVFLPLYFQLVLGKTPAESGLMLVPQIVGMIVSSTYGGRLSSASGNFKSFFLLGVGLEATALALLGVSSLVGAGVVPFLSALAVLGLGTGLGMPNAIVLVQNSVAPEKLGMATGSMSFVRSLSGAIGVALSGFVMRLMLESGHTSSAFIRFFHDETGNTVISGTGSQTVDALRLAIAASFVLGGVMMVAAFATATRVSALEAP